MLDAPNFLAALWGFTMIVVGLNFLVKPKSIKLFFGWLENEKSILGLGIMNLVLGIAFLLWHHSWDMSWRVLITIISWLIVVRGCIMMFFPEFFQKIVAAIKEKSDLISMGLVAVVIVGCFLLYLSFAM